MSLRTWRKSHGLRGPAEEICNPDLARSAVGKRASGNIQGDNTRYPISHHGEKRRQAAFVRTQCVEGGEEVRIHQAQGRCEASVRTHRAQGLEANERRRFT